eukprot:TRINITY_DN591_c0_g2_i1.p1 TRINITY_DN591_c0_g2~~TRINITY_DN591_c0_g2_i1.p1  ORF type:complete len:447 (+),score=103.09 TRINITY_DN591_c0_g2_i1:32-1372(+)
MSECRVRFTHEVEKRALREHVVAVFGDAEAADVAAFMCTQLDAGTEGESGFARVMHFALEEEHGAIASHLVLIRQRLSFDGVDVPVAAMGIVGTIPEHRVHGHQRQLNVEYDKEARRQGLHLSLIAGIPFFYRRLGYEYALNMPWSLPLAASEQTSGTSSVTCTVVTADTFAEYLSMREHAWAHPTAHVGPCPCGSAMVVAAAVPTTPVHIKLTPEDFVYYTTEPFGESCLCCKFFLVKSREDGRPVGSFFLTREFERVIAKELWLEPTVRSAASVREVLCCVRREAAAVGHPAGVTLPFDTELKRLVLESAGASAEPRPYAWYVKLLEPLSQFLQHIRPALDRRLCAAHIQEGRAKLHLFGDATASTVLIEVASGHVTAVHAGPGDEYSADVALPETAALQLVLGYRSLRKLAWTYPDVRINNDATLPLLDALFPEVACDLSLAF